MEWLRCAIAAAGASRVSERAPWQTSELNLTSRNVAATSCVSDEPPLLGRSGFARPAAPTFVSSDCCTGGFGPIVVDMRTDLSPMSLRREAVRNVLAHVAKSWRHVERRSHGSSVPGCAQSACSLTAGHYREARSALRLRRRFSAFAPSAHREFRVASQVPARPSVVAGSWCWRFFRTFAHVPRLVHIMVLCNRLVSISTHPLSMELSSDCAYSFAASLAQARRLPSLARQLSDSHCLRRA